jgi:hypothetical protein
VDADAGGPALGLDAEAEEEPGVLQTKQNSTTFREEKTPYQQFALNRMKVNLKKKKRYKNPKIHHLILASSSSRSFIPLRVIFALQLKKRSLCLKISNMVSLV